jgi:hypothetical protein
MLSDLFGRKPAPPVQKKFFPQNRLEALLMQAARDPSTRSDFYKELLAADLYVLIVPNERQDGKFVAQPGDRLSIKGITVEGRKLIPVFSSELRLREYIQSQDHLAKLNGQALLSMIQAQDQGIVLNPASSYGKEFTPDEIGALVSGSMFQPQKQVIAHDTQVLLGTPKDHPTKTVEAMTRYFQGRSDVKKAYVAWMDAPGSGEAAHLIFAIQVDGDFAPIASDLGVIFRETLGAGQFADLLQLGQGGLDEYFKDQQPFYQK